MICFWSSHKSIKGTLIPSVLLHFKIYTCWPFQFKETCSFKLIQIDYSRSKKPTEASPLTKYSYSLVLRIHLCKYGNFSQLYPKLTPSASITDRCFVEAIALFKNWKSLVKSISKAAFNYPGFPYCTWVPKNARRSAGLWRNSNDAFASGSIPPGATTDHR